MPTAGPVQHISDTARWVATYRAMESERPDAVFHDPYARRLAGAKGEEIVATMKKGRSMAWPMIVRTAVMDEVITRAVRRDGVDTVVNLAAGLDTRPYRLDLPNTLWWIDVDLPDILTYKERQLTGETPACRLESAKVDLTDAAARRSLFQSIGARARSALVLSEGLLIYLPPERVGELARDLHAEAPFRWWLIDLASPRLLKMMERTWGKQLAAGNAPFQFAPAESTAFFEPFGWRETEFRSMWDESIRLKRTMRMSGLWQFLMRLYPRKVREGLRRMSGIVLLERTGGAPS